MEEEGTVVYFENSPAAEGLQEDGESLELIFTSAAPDPALPGEGGGGWEWRGIFCRVSWKLLGLLPNYQNALCKLTDTAVAALRDSPLLTEEDFQLLHCALPPSSLEDEVKGVYSRKPGYTLVGAVVVAMVACVAAISTGGGPLAVAVTASVLSVVVILTLLLVLRTLRQWTRGWEDELSSLSTFTSKMEALLSALAHSLRTIQEVEILSHGYTRLSRSVPIGRLERQPGCHGYQCLVLRRRVLAVCREGVVALRRSTQLLCNGYPLNKELDNRHSYLAFAPVEDLHQWLCTQDTTNEDTGREGDSSSTDKPPSLSLESLKDACNLLGVQTSEFLRRLALTLALCTKTQGEWDRQMFSPAHLPWLLREPCQLASDAHEKLQWSLDFHRNYLFGEPPSRPKSTLSGRRPLQPVAEDVHCLDLKAQDTLRKIRELGSDLARHTRWEDETDIAEEVERIRERVLAIDIDLQTSRGHIADSLRALDELLQPPDNCYGAASLSCPAHDSGSSDVDGLDALQQSPSTDEDEEGSSDEAVFEAYVPPQEGSEDQRRNRYLGDISLEERQELERRQAEAKEVPVRMMKELRSVLAVRDVEREKRKVERRQRRRRRKREHQSEVDATSVQTALEAVQPLTAGGGEETSGEVGKEGVALCSAKLSEEQAVNLAIGSSPECVHLEEGLVSQAMERRLSSEGRGTAPDYRGGASLKEGEGDGSDGGGGERGREWLSMAPQLGSLAQAVMAARQASGRAVSGKTFEEVFGDGSDEDP